MVRKLPKVKGLGDWHRRIKSLKSIGVPTPRIKQNYSAEEKQKVRRLAQKFAEVISAPYLFQVKKSPRPKITKSISGGIRYRNFVAIPTGMRKEAHKKGFHTIVNVNRKGIPTIHHINPDGEIYKKTRLTDLHGKKLLRFLKRENKKVPKGLPKLKKGKSFIRVSIGDRTVNRAFSSWSDVTAFLDYYSKEWEGNDAWDYLSVDYYDREDN